MTILVGGLAGRDSGGEHRLEGRPVKYNGKSRLRLLFAATNLSPGDVGELERPGADLPWLSPKEARLSPGSTVYALVVDQRGRRLPSIRGGPFSEPSPDCPPGLQPERFSSLCRR